MFLCLANPLLFLWQNIVVALLNKGFKEILLTLYFVLGQLAVVRGLLGCNMAGQAFSLRTPLGTWPVLQAEFNILHTAHTFCLPPSSVLESTMTDLMPPGDLYILQSLDPL